MTRKQLELFSVDDMYGCIGVKDAPYKYVRLPYPEHVWNDGEL